MEQLFTFTTYVYGCSSSPIPGLEASLELFIIMYSFSRYFYLKQLTAQGGNLNLQPLDLQSNAQPLSYAIPLQIEVQIKIPDKENWQQFPEYLDQTPSSLPSVCVKTMRKPLWSGLTSYHKDQVFWSTMELFINLFKPRLPQLGLAYPSVLTEPLHLTDRVLQSISYINPAQRSLV